MALCLYLKFKAFEFQYAMLFNQYHMMSSGEHRTVTKAMRLAMIKSIAQSIRRPVKVYKAILMEHALKVHGKWWASKLYHNKEVDILYTKLYDMNPIYALSGVLSVVTNYNVDEYEQVMILEHDL